MRRSDDQIDRPNSPKQVQSVGANFRTLELTLVKFESPAYVLPGRQKAARRSGAAAAEPAASIPCVEVERHNVHEDLPMSITVCTGKLHRARVTGARLDYEGSITIDPLLMRAAGIEPFQLVHVNSLANAVHWETYAIPGKTGQGEICLNGCPARLFQPDDYVIILSLEQMSRQKAAKLRHRVVYLDANNQVLRVETKTPAKATAKVA